MSYNDKAALWNSMLFMVGRCSLTVSNPVFKSPMVSTRVDSAYDFCA